MPSPLPTVVVMFALQREAAALVRFARAEPRARLWVSGMGRARAEQAVAEILRDHPPAVVVTAGFAGALRPDLTVGEVLYDADPGLALARFLAEAGARPGRFHTAERMLITATEKAACRQQTGADAVEMESGWIRLRCRAAGVPSATVRAISDLATEDLPLDLNQLTDREQQISLFKLAGAVASRPGVLRGLMRMQRQSAAAARALGEVLERALRGWWGSE